MEEQKPSGSVTTYYNKKYPPNLEKSNLFPYQIEATKRLVQRARFQKGVILWHSMGSGKTLTSLYILKNYDSVHHKWLIILPKGLDGEWIKGLQELMGGSKDRDSVKSLIFNMDFLDYSELSANIGSPQCYNKYQKRFEGSYVVCDEAHRLLALFRNQRKQSEEDDNVGSERPMDRLFALASRVILVTGTPMQKDIGDLGILINIVAKNIVAPFTSDMFLQTYSLPPTLKSHGFSLGATISTIVTPAVNLLGTLAATVVFSQKTLDYYISSGDTADKDSSLFNNVSQGLHDYSSWILAAGIFFRWISACNRRFNTVQLDMGKFITDFGPYISYFDFEKSLEDNPANKNQMPVKKIIDREVKLDDFQMLQFVNMAFDAGTSSLNELRIVSRISLQDKTGAAFQTVEARDDFNRLSRVVGNLSMDCLVYEPARIEYIKIKGKQQSAGIYENNYRAVILSERKNDGLGIKEYVFGCKKFLQVLKDLYELRQKYDYIPVVYSCFDKYGFQLFSAFLTSVNVPHLVVHPSDSITHREKVMESACRKHARWTPDFFADSTEKLEANRENPLCVLIHPTLTEGLSFNYNPAILVLEIPMGYGVREQIYARVLRKLKPELQVVRDLMAKDGLVYKEIYQYSAKNTRFEKNLSRFELPNFSIPNPFDIKFDSSKVNKVKYTTFISELSDIVYEPNDNKPLSPDGFAGNQASFLPLFTNITGSISYATVLKGLSKATRQSVKNKDFFTLLFEDFKHAIFKTGDENVDESNQVQSFQMRAIKDFLSKQNDDTVKVANKVPIRLGQEPIPNNSQEAPPEICSCKLFDPDHPDDTNACSLKPMSEKEMIERQNNKYKTPDRVHNSNNQLPSINRISRSDSVLESRSPPPKFDKSFLKKTSPRS